MTKLITAAIATLVLASCEGLNISFQDEQFGTGSYSSKGGLLVAPKAVQLIAPAE